MWRRRNAVLLTPPYFFYFIFSFFFILFFLISFFYLVFLSLDDRVNGPSPQNPKLQSNVMKPAFFALDLWQNFLQLGFCLQFIQAAYSHKLIIRALRGFA